MPLLSQHNLQKAQLNKHQMHQYNTQNQLKNVQIPSNRLYKQQIIKLISPNQRHHWLRMKQLKPRTQQQYLFLQEIQLMKAPKAYLISTIAQRKSLMSSVNSRKKHRNHLSKLENRQRQVIKKQPILQISLKNKLLIQNNKPKMQSLLLLQRTKPIQMP